jgi:hypothetical protein
VLFFVVFIEVGDIISLSNLKLKVQNKHL